MTQGLPNVAPLPFLPEALFLQALSLERKRAERARRGFVLMILEQERTSERRGEADGLATVVPAIVSAIRETDIAGWHRQHSALGVIFAELGPADSTTIVGILRAKMMRVLGSVLPPEAVARFRTTFHRYPDDWEDDGTGRTIVRLYPDLVQRDQAMRVSRAIKRSMDLLGSAIVLLLLAPMLLAIALAIKLTSPGPVLFRQQRIGQYGVPFTLLKFRSMRVGNDARIHREYVQRFIAGADSTPSGSGAPVYKVTHDPRVTRIGRVLRRTSLDEFPQFFNVLRGEMSMVGPRPPVPYELEAYDIWHRRRLLGVKPGITGLWQVNGRSRLPFNDMVRLDVHYAANWSLWLDLKILLRTPLAVLSGDGAY